MSVREQVCWIVLESAHNQTINMRQKLQGHDEQVSPVENGVGIGELKKKLVIRYSKNEIEDSLYFLEQRGYLQHHGFGLISPRLAYSLTQKALDTIERGTFEDEEIVAFDQSKLFRQQIDASLENADAATKIWLAIFRVISAYGESPLRVSATALIVILLCAAVYQYTGIMSNELQELTHSFTTNLYFSIVTFTTLGYGDFSPPQGVARFVATIEAILGLFLMSLFLVTLVRRFGRT